jgi:hypothetical protein
LLAEAIEYDPTRAMAYHALGMLRRSQADYRMHEQR